ncbi:MAG: hypothetical protein JSU03_08395 [Bacteroidetes bacterium]|nr:hypothetical protein [Bacteroidota bacterium]MBS1757283.1 hypothetical protein [Bacteroidota bacterium]
MQIKRTFLATTVLLIATICLFISAKITPIPPSAPSPNNSVCCKNHLKDKTFSPWNFVTQGILHITI